MSDDRPATDSDGVPPSISELIRDWQGRTGQSLHKAAAQSKVPGAGKGATQAYLQKALHGKAPGWPTPSGVVGIAAALDTTPLAVLLGFAVHHNLPVRMPALASQLPPEIDQAPESQRDALLAMAWAIARPEMPVRRFTPDDAIPDVSEVDELIDHSDESDAGGQG